MTLADRALRELHDAGLIFCFRAVPAPPDAVTGASPGDTTDRLDAAEVDALLRDDWWWGPGPYPGVYFAATDAGVAAIKDPPACFRSIWSF